jgi:transcriptional antiterminator
MVTFPNLRSEMARTGVNNHQIAETLHISERAYRNKLNGITGFLLSEALVLRRTFFPELTIEELFKNDTQESEVSTWK